MKVTPRRPYPRVPQGHKLPGIAATKIRPHDLPIMIVDDDREILRSMVEALKAAGYKNISVFESPKAALAAYQQRPNKPKIIIADFCLPEMTGTELMVKVAVLSGRKKPHFIMHTGNPAPAPTTAAGQTLERLHVDYVQKGLDLLAVVEQAAKNKTNGITQSQRVVLSAAPAQPNEFPNNTVYQFLSHVRHDFRSVFTPLGLRYGLFMRRPDENKSKILATIERILVFINFLNNFSKREDLATADFSDINMGQFFVKPEIKTIWENLPPEKKWVLASIVRQYLTAEKAEKGKKAMNLSEFSREIARIKDLLTTTPPDPANIGEAIKSAIAALENFHAATALAEGADPEITGNFVAHYRVLQGELT